VADPRGWWSLCALAALGAVLAWPQPPTALDWQPTLLAVQPWRAVSAAWVHLSPLHLAANLAGTALVAALGRVAGCGPRAAWAWAIAWPLTQLGLLVQPALAHYGGLSGVLHAAVAVAALQLVLNDRGQRQLIGTLLLAGLAAKLLLEAPGAGPLRRVVGWDIAIAPLAHASGAAAGTLCALVLLRPRRRRPGDAAAPIGPARRATQRPPKNRG
jgi:rhomboid family GlyGly-CTERM serine protease